MLNACPTHINLKVYRPRKPQDSAYYRCVEDCFETFEQVYQERFERKYGFFRPYVRQVIYRYFQPILANCRVDITILILYMGWEFIGWSRFDPTNYVTPMGLIAGAMLIFLNYEGFELIANASAEITDPERSLPIAYVGGLLLAIIDIDRHCGHCRDTND
jgi:hypothetical protein